MQDNKNVIDYLKLLAPSIPGHVFWKDKNSVYLGMNELTLKASGLKSYTDFIGKTDYDLWPEFAEELIMHDKEVLATENIITCEETISQPNKTIKYFTVTKFLMRDNSGNIVGIIGNSIDVTAEKEAQELKIENQLQSAVLKEQESFKKIVGQMIHDIQSPLASLQMMIVSNTHIAESERLTLRTAAANIADITNNMLKRYRGNREVQTQQVILVSTILLEVISQKRYEYRDTNIELEYNFDKGAYFAFTRTNASSFRNALSNIINNARESYKDKVDIAQDVVNSDKNKNKISLSLYIKDNKLIVGIADNGCGMSSCAIAKIQQGFAFTYGKANGHGIGLTQVRDMLYTSGAKLNITSKTGVSPGTTIELILPLSDAPKWATSKIQIKEADTIVILDDNSSIHNAWDSIIKSLMPHANIKHFTYASDAICYVKSMIHDVAATWHNNYNKDDILLLTDYELIDQGINGMDVIKELKLERSILVTSHYDNQAICDEANRYDVRIIPKGIVDEISN